MSGRADWQLPAGVSRAVWDYVHDSATAQNYDANLIGTPLLDTDLRFVRSHLPANSHVIDLGCGTGRVAIPLAQAGHRVVGVDLSQPMLSIARNKPGGSQVTWAAANIVDLAAFGDSSFDAAICMFSTLGMVAGAEARQQAITEAHRILRPGGLMLLHVHHLGHLLTSAAGRRSWCMNRIKRLAWRHDSGDFPMPSANGLPGWTMHLFSKRETHNLLHRAGFSIEQMVSVSVEGTELHWPHSVTGYGFLIAARKLAK